MRGERGRTRPMAGNSPRRALITLDGDAMAVRDGLRTLFAMSPLREMTSEGRGTAEIVLAEVLNNIVEHAYARHPGKIEVLVELVAPELVCQIRDSGLPMPGECLPTGLLRPLGEQDELPEGGFGWFLIRTLARDLAYRRADSCNQLSFRLDAC